MTVMMFYSSLFFRALLFNHMAEWHSFNVGQPDNLGESQCTPLEMGIFKK